MRKIYLTLIIALLAQGSVFAQGWPANYGGVMLQGFFWDSYKETPDNSPWGPWQYHSTNDGTALQKKGYTWATMYGAGWTEGEEWQVPITTWKSLLEHKNEITPFIDLIWLPQSGSTVADSTTIYNGKDISGRAGVRKWRKGQEWDYNEGNIITNPDCMGFVPVFYFHHGLSYEYNDQGELVPWRYKDSSGKWWTPISYFGTEAELRELISTYKAEGTGAIEDVVANHRGGLGTWLDNPTAAQLIEFPTEYYKGQFCPEGEYISWSSDDVCSDDECDMGDHLEYPGTGQPDCGGKGEWARDIDHHSPATQLKIKKFLDFLKNDLGYVGFRYDYAMGFEEKHFAEYNTALRPTFSVGEYWGQQGDIEGWIKKTYDEGGYQSAAFDFPLQAKIKEVFNAGDHYDWLDGAGLISNDRMKRYAVTFIDNHDTFKDLPTDGSNFNWDTHTGYNHRVSYRVLEANAFILAMPGTPCLFYPHFMHPQWHDAICTMIKARRIAGINNESTRWAMERLDNGTVQWRVSGTKGDIYIQLGNDVANAAVPEGYTQVWQGDVARYCIQSDLYSQVTDVNYKKTNLVQGYPVINTRSGNYKNPVNVNVKPSSEGCTLVYTTDGKEPTANSEQITDVNGKNIYVTDHCTLKVGILLDGEVAPGSVVTREYVIDEATDNKVRVFVKVPNVSETNIPYIFAWENNGNQLTSNFPGWGMNGDYKQIVGGVEWFVVSFNPTGTTTNATNTHLLTEENNQNGINMILSWGGDDSKTGNITGVTGDVFYTFAYGTPQDLTPNYINALHNPSVDIDKASGTYDGTIYVKLTASTEKLADGETPCKVVYSLDGSEPTAESASFDYSGTVTLNPGSYTLRAGVLYNGKVINQEARTYNVTERSTPFNGMRIAIRCNTAPNLYLFDVEGTAPSDETFTTWGGKQLIETVKDEDNYTWYYATFEGMTKCSIVLNNRNGGQTENIVDLTGDSYIIYDNNNYYLNVTGLTSHKSYLLFQPRIDKWADAGAVMQLYVNGVGDNMSMTKIGGWKDGDPIYLWSDDEHDVANNTAICFKRKNPNNLDDQWAYANTTYTKGGYYYDDGVDWNEHVQLSKDVNFANFKYPNLPYPETNPTVIPSCATWVDAKYFFYFENNGYIDPYVWVTNDKIIFTGTSWPGEQLVEKVGVAANGNAVYRWSCDEDINGVGPENVIFNDNGNWGTQTQTFDYVKGGYYTTSEMVGVVSNNLVSLAGLISSSDTQKEFVISDDLRAIGVDNSGTRIIAKEADAEVVGLSETDGKKVHKEMKNWTYDTGKWIEIELPQNLAIAPTEINSFTNKSLKAHTMVGKLTYENGNPVFKVIAKPTTTRDVWDEFVPNKYTAANFMPEYGNNQNFVLVEPQPQEYATIEWAVYEGNNTFSMPLTNAAGTMDIEITGAVKLSSNDNYIDMDRAGFVEGTMYRLNVIVKRKASQTGDGVPMLMSEVTPSDEWEVALISAASGEEVYPTAINCIDEGKELVKVRYYNMMGVESATPFEGVNIVVREYSDGSRIATKVLRK